MDGKQQSPKGKKVLITGGGGWFGQRVAREMLRNGYQVALLDINYLETDFADEISAATRIKASITDKQALEEATVGCDGVFHLAAYGMSGSASLNREPTYSINVTGTQNVLDACLKNGVPRVVFASSVGVVFSDKEIIDGDETMPYAPADSHIQYYSVTKTIAEKNVLAHDRRSFQDGVKAKNGETELRTAALRFRGIYGPGEQRTIQRTLDMCRKGLMVMTFGKGSQCLTQYSGEQTSSQAFRLAYESLSKQADYVAGGQSYFIVDETPTDAFEFWRPLFNYLGVPYPRLRLPYFIVYYLAAIMELLYHATGIEPVFTKYEVNLIGITNYYRIDKAKKELGLEPIEDHNLKPIIEDCRQKYGYENHATKYLLIYSCVFVPLLVLLCWQIAYLSSRLM